MPTDTHLVICESAIDCLSHYALFWRDHSDVGQRTRYISTGGAWSPKTPALLKKAAGDHPGQHIVLSFDHDEQGKEYIADGTVLLGKLTKQLSKALLVKIPSRYKDWNEQLVNQHTVVSCRDV